MRRLLHRALRILTSVALADAIIGDLDELRRARACPSRFAGALWFWREATAILLHATGRRMLDFMRRVIPVRPLTGRFSGDLRYAARSLAGSPWYGVSTVSVIALGFALSTTVFAVVDGVLFKPLPYRAADELYLAYARDSTNKRRGAIRLSPKDVRDWTTALPHARFAMFEIVGDISTFGVVNGRPVGAAFIDADFLGVLGVRPALGGFAPGDFVVSATGPFAKRGVPGAAPPSETIAALVSYSFWQRFFGGDLSAIGRIFQAPDLPELSFRVAGVLPPDFVFPAARTTPEILLPLGIPPSVYDKRTPEVRAIARLPSTMPFAEYQARLDAAMRAALPEYPASWQFDSVRLSAMNAELGGSSASAFGLVFGAAAGLALLACVNVAGLAIARARNRHRSFALRRALGASGWDLWRLVLAEVLLLVLGGSLAGLLLANSVLDVVVRLLPEELALYKEPSIDVRVGAFVLLLTTGATLAIALAAARAGAEARLSARIASASPGLTAQSAITRFVVIGLQIAVALVLALGGTLLVVSGANVLAEETGFDIDRTLALTVHIGAGPRQANVSRLDTLIQAMQRQPVVQQVGVLDASFMTGGNATPPVEWPEHARHVKAEGVMVASGFFQVAGLELVSGRFPSAEELDSSERLAVVSEQVARGFWPDRPAIGQTLQGAKWADRSDIFKVVGVVRDARLQALDMEPYGQIYLPIRAFGARRAPTILVRTRPGAREVIGALVAAIDALGSPYSLQRIEPLADRVRDSVRIRVFQAWLFGSFAASAVVIAGVGVFGLIAMAVGHRAREMAIRIALGSSRRGLVRLLVVEQVSAVVTGLLGGGIAAAWAAGVLRSYVYQITVYDPLVWIATIAIVMMAALLGALVPSWRASRFDPVHALRTE